MRLALLAVLVLCSCASASPFDPVEPARPFVFQPPAGFKELSAKQKPADCLFAYSDNLHPPVQLFISQESRVMAQAEGLGIKAALRPLGSSVFRENWQGVSIYGMRTTTGEEDRLYVALNIYVPLSTCTVVLDTQCYVEREEAALLALRQTLTSLKGQTRWRKDAQPESSGVAIPGPATFERVESRSYRHDREDRRDYPRQSRSREDRSVSGSVNQLFWASFFCSMPFALIGCVFMLRHRRERGFTATKRPLYGEPRGWGGPVPPPRKA
jgi:hypothetical protein